MFFAYGWAVCRLNYLECFVLTLCVVWRIKKKIKIKEKRILFINIILFDFYLITNRFFSALSVIFLKALYLKRHNNDNNHTHTSQWTMNCTRLEIHFIEIFFTWERFEKFLINKLSGTVKKKQFFSLIADGRLIRRLFSLNLYRRTIKLRQNPINRSLFG